MYVAVGRFTLREKSALFKFLRMSKRIEEEAQDFEACLDVNLMGGTSKTFYVATLWSDMQEMAKFVESGTHLEAMKMTSELSDEIRLLYFEGDKLPSKIETQRLIDEHPKVRVLKF